MVAELISILLFAATITIDLIIDIRKWKREEYAVNHNKKWIRGFGLVPAVVLLSWGNWILLAPAIPMVLFWYWMLFDGLYNLLRRYGWWYLGTDDPDDAKTDNFLQRLKLWQHIAIKVGGLVLFTVIYIICN